MEYDSYIAAFSTFFNWCVFLANLAFKLTRDVIHALKRHLEGRMSKTNISSSFIKYIINKQSR